MNTLTQKLEALRDDFLGQRARFFLYTVTHNTAVVEVEGRGGRRAFLVMSGCTAVRMPSSWWFVVPEIREVEGEKGLYQLVDETSDILVEFEHLELRDSYPAVGELP